MMKAFVCRGYGSPDVLELADVEQPIPKDHEILIRIHATTVSAGDRRVRSLDMPRGFGLMSRLIFGITKPRQPILGSELAGIVETVGWAVTRFKPGDRVFADNGASMGCHADYKTMPQDGAVALIPANLSFEDAAPLSFGAVTALNFLRKAGIAHGDRVLVNGASGCVGSAAVQLARHFGAHVTGVTSTANVERVRTIGAQAIIDYTKDDFVQAGESWDIVVDAVGTLSYRRCKTVLKPGGRLLLVAADLPALLSAPFISMAGNHKVIAGPANGTADDLRFLAGLAETGAYRPLIDRIYPFTQMTDAHRHADSGRKRGSVVVRVDCPEQD